jgi:tricorn protease
MTDRRIPRLRLAAGLAIAVLLGLQTPDAPGAEGLVDLPRYPAISPDGAQITFSWRGDLWLAPASGGRAERLTIHPGDDTRSLWRPDGEHIAFASNRDGTSNIWMMDVDGANIRKVTEIDRPVSPQGFAVDDAGDEVITFSTTLEGDVFKNSRPYMISVDGGDIHRVHDAFGSEPRFSPDGGRVVFVRNGYYDARTRRSYRGPEAAEIWLLNRADGAFTQLTHFDGQDVNPKWGGDRTVLFLSDREMDTFNLYRMSAAEGDGACVRITSFEGRGVNDYDVTPDGSMAILQVWDALYTLDLDDPAASPVKIEVTAIQDENDEYMFKAVGRSVSEAALSPDGEVMATIAYGEVYIRNIEDGSPTRRVTESHARERDIAWSPDGLKLYFTTDEGGVQSIHAATVALTRGELKEDFEKATTPEEEPEEAEEVEDLVTGSWTGSITVGAEDPVDCSIMLELGDDNAVTGALTSVNADCTLAGTFDPETNTLTLTMTDQDDNATEITMTIAEGALTATFVLDGQDVMISATRDEDDADKNKGDKKKEEEELPKELQPDRWHDAMTFTIEPVVVREEHAREANPSPDGTKLGYRGVRGDYFILDLETGETIQLLAHWDPDMTIQWSPCGKYVAYSRSDLNYNEDIFVAPADGSAEPVNITRHPDSDVNPQWSADGKIISFSSERVNEEYDIYAVYLDKDLEALPKQELKQYYKDAVAAAKKRTPLKIDPPADEDDEADDEDEKAKTPKTRRTRPKTRLMRSILRTPTCGCAD